jgi:outer membrane protein
MTSIRTRSSRLAFVAAVAVVAPVASLRAQQASPGPSAAPTVGAPRRLSLAEALRMAESQSEAVQVARAAMTRAQGQHYQARSQYFPQLSAVGSYFRTLRSQFQGLNVSGPTDTTTSTSQSVCAPNIPATATPAERDAALAQAITCPAAGGGGFDFSKTGFGAANAWTLGLSFSQNVFAGGRIAGQNQAATASLRAASIEIAAQRAQIALDVTQAYYDAALADRLVSIQETALGQTDEVLRQTRVARQVGNQSEYDLLRAQVTRDNQVPVLLQIRNNRRVAYYRLKQLLNIGLDDSLDLATQLEDSTADRVAVVAAMALVNENARGASALAALDTNVSDRAPVRQMEQTVHAQEGLLRAAKGERLPSLQITSGYQRLYFPTSVFPQLNQARENWTVGVSASLPLFTGGRIKGSELIAQGNLAETRARLQQTRELAALDTRVALSALEQAEASWRASAGTAAQAARAYSIDQIRYQEGISTQTDLTQSRLMLEQARANRALAARDLAVARVKLALLKDLPLQAGGAGAAAAQMQSQTGGTAGGALQQQTQQQTQQRSSTPAAAGASGIAGGGVTP